MYQSRDPPLFSASTSTLSPNSIISRSVGNAVPGSHVYARVRESGALEDVDRVLRLDVVFQDQDQDLVRILAEEVVDGPEGVNGAGCAQLAVDVAEVHLARVD